jgi:hypothetical protein
MLGDGRRKVVLAVVRRRADIEAWKGGQELEGLVFGGWAGRSATVVGGCVNVGQSRAT